MAKETKTGRIAIISDIHGNKTALDAALHEISRKKDIERIVCLGDNVGYCGQTVEVVRTLRDKGIHSCLGNHEEALKLVAGGIKEGGLKLMGINPIAARSIVGAYTQLTRAPDGKELLTFLIGTPERHYEDGLPERIQIGKNARGCHSFRDEKGSMRYFMSAELADKYGIKHTNLFQKPKTVVDHPETFTPGLKSWFLGHTHVPTAHVFESVPGKKLKDHEYVPQRVEFTTRDGKKGAAILGFKLGRGYRGIVNVGSIGISRRRDYETIETSKGNAMLPAYYAIYNPDDGKVDFVEFYYEIEKVREETKKAFGEKNIFTKLERRKWQNLD